MNHSCRAIISALYNSQNQCIVKGLSRRSGKTHNYSALLIHLHVATHVIQNDLLMKWWIEFKMHHLTLHRFKIMYLIKRSWFKLMQWAGSSCWFPGGMPPGCCVHMSVVFWSHMPFNVKTEVVLEVRFLTTLKAWYNSCLSISFFQPGLVQQAQASINWIELPPLLERCDYFMIQYDTTDNRQ